MQRKIEMIVVINVLIVIKKLQVRAHMAEAFNVWLQIPQDKFVIICGMPLRSQSYSSFRNSGDAA